jgi:ADP-ribosylation factor-binding protein GGA
MCEEESDDSEAVAKLLEINDSIHRTIERYKLVKKGDLDAASKIPKGTLGTSTGVTKSADNELSLIDLGGDAEPSANGLGGPSMEVKQDSLEDDLLGLSIQGDHYGQGGGIALGSGVNSSASCSHLATVFKLIQGSDIPGPSLLSSSSQNSTSQLPRSSVSPQPQQTTQSSMANYDPFASLASSQPSSQPVAPVMTVGKQPQSTSRPAPSADPFAILSNPTPRQSSPFEYQQQSSVPVPSASPSLFDFGQPTKPQSQPNQPSLAAQQNNGTNAEEEWTFASSLPDQANLPPVNEVMVTNTAVNVVFAVSRPAGDDTSITMVVRSSNNTAQPISEFTFQIAVPKVSSISVAQTLGIPSPSH